MSTNNPTVSSFLATYRACTDGAAWAIKSFGPAAPMDAAFDAAKALPDLTGPQAKWVVWAMTRDGVLSLAQLRRFALHCAQAALKYTEDQPVHAAVQTVAAYLDGKATREELRSAHAAADAANADAATGARAWAATAASAASAASAATDVSAIAAHVHTAHDAAAAASYWVPAAARRRQAAHLLQLFQGLDMPNAINRIHCYWLHGTWCFDDAPRGLVAEPFVAGADAIITTAAAVSGIENPVQTGVNVTFSDRDFPGRQFKVTRQEASNGGYWYVSDPATGSIRGWLCPALFRYFTEAPEAIFFAVS